MTAPLPSPLSRFDSNLLRAVEKLVPATERVEWRRAWQADLWHLRHHSRTLRPMPLGVTTDLSIGLVCDALWLRTDSWRRTFSGTAIFCLAAVAGLLLFSTLVGLALCGSWNAMGLYLAAPFKRFLVEAPLAAIVTFAFESHTYGARGSASGKLAWIKGRLFFAAKTSLLLLLAFLSSANLCQPIHAALPNTSFIFQNFFFMLLAVVALRWSFRDQEQRCKQCLRSLATPERVGRPSHNFLEWNGTELLCKQGHGLLSVPEMETSWCRSSQWLEQSRAWDRVASL
jgi:hypothetical protein